MEVHLKMGVDQLLYPRVIAHRGLSGLCPENTMAAFGAAIGIGAHEIELDIWGSKDRQLMVCHDPTVDRTSNGTGHINKLTYEYISQLDAGSWFDPKWAGLSFCTLEEVFKVYGGDIIMNIHLKEAGADGWIIEEVQRLAERYGIADSIYIAGRKDILQWAIRIAPDIERCCLEGDRDEDMTIVDRAIEYGCSRVQFWNPNFNKDLIDRAHDHGIICNLFYADTYEEAERCFNMGIDSVLTNYANLILPVLENMR